MPLKATYAQMQRMNVYMLLPLYDMKIAFAFAFNEICIVVNLILFAVK